MAFLYNWDRNLTRIFSLCVYANVIDISAIHKHLVSSILNYTVDINVLVVVISLDEGKYYSQGKWPSAAPGTQHVHAHWNYMLDFYCNLSWYYCLIETPHSSSSAYQGGWAYWQSTPPVDQESNSLHSEWGSHYWLVSLKSLHNLGSSPCCTEVYEGVIEKGAEGEQGRYSTFGSAIRHINMCVLRIVLSRTHVIWQFHTFINTSKQ